MSASEHARRAARASWPVRKHRLGAEPGDDLAKRTTPEERLAMMWPLACAAWDLAGRPLPDYARTDTPVRVVRPRGAAPGGERVD